MKRNIEYDHHERIKNPRPFFRLDLVRLQWKYLKEFPQDIEPKLFLEMLIKRVINEKEYYEFLFAENYNLACQFAKDISQFIHSKNPEVYCNRCPWKLQSKEPTVPCKIEYFQQYDKLLKQLKFNINEYVKRKSQYVNHLHYDPYKNEIIRIKKEIKDLIETKILLLEIRLTYFKHCVYGIKDDSIKF